MIMQIPAFASCYGSKDFTGQISIDLTEVAPGWYRINDNDNIANIKGLIKLDARHQIWGAHIELKFDEIIFSGSGTITAETEDLIAHGYISIDNEYGPSSLKKNQLHHLSITPKTRIGLSAGFEKTFTPDDPERFFQKPFGFINIYACIDPNFLYHN